MKKTHTAAAAVLILGLINSVSLQAQQNNLFPRGDFARGTQVDNLWDGVSRGNQLQLPPTSRVAPRENATVSSLGMPASVVMADVTNNGLPDIVAGTPEGYLWVFPNTGERGKPKFTRGEIMTLTAYVPGRWTGQGVNANEASLYVPRLHVVPWSTPTGLDMVVGTFYGEIFRIPISAAGGKITFRNFDALRSEIRLSGTPNYYFMNLADPVVVDWNGDGKKDLILGEGSFSANTIWFLENAGTDASPRFEAQNAVPLIEALGNFQLKPAVLDWNNNGRLDLFVVDEKGDAVVYLREANGSLGEPKPVLAGGKNFGTMSSVKPVDFNGDGKFDLLIGRTSGAIQIALNTGTAEAPAFSAPAPIAGTDVLLPFERPTGWSLDTAIHVPFGVMEIFEDPTNTAGQGFSGGNCLRFYFLEPQNSLVTGEFPRPSRPHSHSLRSDSPIRLNIGKSYEISFRYSSTGFSKITWFLDGVINAKDQKTDTNVTRRGEQRGGPGNVRLGESKIEGDLRNGSWSTVRQTITVPSLPNSQDIINHTLRFNFEGMGDFRLDDVSVVAR